MEILLLYYICSFFTVLIHELGHLAAVLYVKYTVKAFIVGPFVIVKHDGKNIFRLRKDFISGLVAFERNVLTKSVRNELIVFSSGIAANFIVGICLVAVYFLTANFYEMGILIIIGILSIIMGFTNCIPMKIKSLNLDTDAVHIIRLYKEKMACQ